MGFSNVKDNKLTEAENITKKIFSENLGSEKHVGYMTSKYLQGLDGKKDYILVECETGGYAIYEEESMEIIQYSDMSNSPFYEIEEEDSYYGGPSNYYKKNGNVIENINNARVKIGEKEQLKLAEEIKQDINQNRKNRVNNLQNDSNETIDCGYTQPNKE